MGWMLRPQPANTRRSRRSGSAGNLWQDANRRRRLIRTVIWIVAVPVVASGWWAARDALQRYVGDARAMRKSVESFLSFSIP